MQNLTKLTVVFLLALTLVGTSVAQKTIKGDDNTAIKAVFASAVQASAPSVWPASMNCQKIVGTNQYPAVQNFQMKYNAPLTLTEVEKQYVHTPPVELSGNAGVYNEPNHRFTVQGSISNAYTGNIDTLKWSSTKRVYAALMRGGPWVTMFYYPEGAIRDEGLLTYNNYPVSYVILCVGPPGTTAGNAVIDGRVVDGFGKPLKGVFITVRSATGTLQRHALTNPFGYYVVDDLPVGEMYLVTAEDRRYTFSETQKLVSLLDSAMGIDFVGTRVP